MALPTTWCPHATTYRCTPQRQCGDCHAPSWGMACMQSAAPQCQHGNEESPTDQCLRYETKGQLSNGSMSNKPQPYHEAALAAAWCSGESLGTEWLQLQTLEWRREMETDTPRVCWRALLAWRASSSSCPDLEALVAHLIVLLAATHQHATAACSDSRAGTQPSLSTQTRRGWRH